MLAQYFAAQKMKPNGLKKRLTDFKTRKRTNDAGNMTSVENTLSDEDIENRSHSVANLY